MAEAAHARSGGASRERLAAVGTNRNPEAIKIAIVQMALAGKSYRLIAEELDIPKGVVSGVIYRARKALVSSPAPVKAKAAEPAPRPKPKVVPKPQPATIGAPIWQPHPVDITDTKEGQCRWPLWKADAPFSQKFVCGNPVQPGQSYCAHCYGLSASRQYTAYVDGKLNLKKLRAA